MIHANTPSTTSLTASTAALLTDNTTHLKSICQLKHPELIELISCLGDDNDLLFAAAITDKTFPEIWPPFAAFILETYALPSTAPGTKQRNTVDQVIALFATGMPSKAAAAAANAAAAAAANAAANAAARAAANAANAATYAAAAYAVAAAAYAAAAANAAAAAAVNAAAYAYAAAIHKQVKSAIRDKLIRIFQL